MTRFMLAFLQDGAVDGVSILKPETVRQMETRQFEFHPMLPGLGITFMEYLIDPVRIIAHGGDTVYFHSDMILAMRTSAISYPTTALVRTLVAAAAKFSTPLRTDISQVQPIRA